MSFFLFLFVFLFVFPYVWAIGMTSCFVNRLPTLTRWVDTKWALAITTVAFALVSVILLLVHVWAIGLT